MQCVTITSLRYHMRYHTHYRTFSIILTWVTHNATRYHDFIALQHALPLHYALHFLSV